MNMLVVERNVKPHTLTRIIYVISLVILGAFAKFRKATISCVMSVRLSVRMEQLGSHWNDFHEIWYLCIFRKYVEKFQVLLKPYKNNGYFIWRPVSIFLIISRSIILRMKNVSDKICRENENTHFVFNNFFFKSCRLWDSVEKYCRTGLATGDNMAHEHFTLGT
jgi:hypothetical protein